MSTPQPQRPPPGHRRSGDLDPTLPPNQSPAAPPATVAPQADGVPTLPPQSPSSAPAGTTVVGIGATLGPYELLDKLGEGGMGAVYKARHQHLDKMVAVKILPQHFTSQPESVTRFKREMRAVGKLTHPNIVQAFDAGEIGGTHFLAMELVEGTDLQKLVNSKGPLSPANACRALRQAAIALAAAHAVGLVHRDIKPSNLLVAKNGQIKLLDLGLARLAGTAGKATDLTTAGQAFGTPDYMAPEQWEDAREADPRTDLYALGCTLFFLLTGHAPFEDDKHQSTVSKMTAHVLDKIPDLKAARPDVPDGIAAIYERLVAKQPDERFQNGADLAAALQPFASSKTNAPGNPVSAAAAEAGGSVKAASLREDQTRSSRSAAAVVKQGAKSLVGKDRKKWLLIGSGILGALLLLAGLVVKLKTKDGTLIVTVNEPDAEVQVLNEEGQVEITRKGEQGPITISVDPGKHRLKVSKEGFELFTQEFSLDAKGKEQITAKLVPLEEKPAVAGTGWHGWPADAPKPAIAPFDAAQAKKHQAEWASYLKVPVEYSNSIGMKFVLIPPGEFKMGSAPEEIQAAQAAAGTDDRVKNEIRTEGPQHRVVLTEPLYVGVHEVTQGQYSSILKTNPSHYSPTGRGREKVGLDTSAYPVELVSWDDAAEFCTQLSLQEQLPPFSFDRSELESDLELDGTGYRLPSEACWEFACRAGTTTRYWTGDTDDSLLEKRLIKQVNGDGVTHGVTEEGAANPFGLFNLHGNVWEWVSDDWGQNVDAPAADQPAVNPSGLSSSEGNLRTVRGGSSGLRAYLLRSASRSAEPRKSSNGDRGFRVAISVNTVRQALRKQAAGKWPADAPKPAIAPFDAAQAKQHQEEWAAYLKVPVEYENSIGMKFRLIPPGEFLMGSTPEEIAAALKDLAPNDTHSMECIRSEAPRRKVILTQPIYLGVTEVTQADYERVMGVNPAHFSAGGERKHLVTGLETTRFPVESVSWNDAVEFASRLSQLEKRKPFYSLSDETVTPLEGEGYRLPSEAEWEFACRAGTTSRYWSGDTVEALMGAGWFVGNSGGRPHATGELKANPFGVHDTLGNLREWVQDGWDANWYDQFQDQAAINPNIPYTDKPLRMVRSGTWLLTATLSRSSQRYSYAPMFRFNDFGFRLALAVDAVKAVVASHPASGKLFLHDPAFPQWVKDVQAMPAEKQLEAVSKKLVELNPGFDGKLFHHVDGGQGQGVPKIENGVVTELHFYTDKVTDLSPVRALTGLKVLSAFPTNFASELTDLSPLQGMQLTDLLLTYNSKLSDISPLKGMPLTSLRVAATEVSDLTPIKDMPLTWLEAKMTDLSLLQGMKLTRLAFGGPIADLKPLQGMKLTHLTFGGPIADLKPLRGMPLEFLQANYTPIADLSPLKGMPLTHLELYGCGNISDVSSLHDCKTLKILRLTETKVTAASVAALQKALPDCKIEWVAPPPASGKLFMHDPAFPQWVKDVQAMPAEQQVEAVSKKLVELNPGFDGKLGGDVFQSHPPKIENGAVTELQFFTDNVTDISPVRAFTNLTTLWCFGNQRADGMLADLSPLKGMKLTHLDCACNPKFSDLSALSGMPLTRLVMQFNTSVSDLTPLTGMPLKTLILRDSQVTDLSPLKNMMLTYLDVWGCRQLSDLSPLKDMKLERFVVTQTKILDLSLLSGMPLRDIELDFKPERDSDLLRSIKTLERINLMPAEEFWKEVESRK